MVHWRDVMEFWFGDIDDDGLPDAALRQRWFQPSRAFDDEVRRRFSSWVLLASEDALSPWREVPEGALAEILLLDQFPRNIYRYTPMAFAFDAQARQRCHEALARADDTRLIPIQRLFLFMPLQHSERLEDQQRCTGLLEQLSATLSGRARDYIRRAEASAREHEAIIARFGRFPHRNPILGRPSSPDEALFLQEGPHFGQGRTSR